MNPTEEAIRRLKANPDLAARVLALSEPAPPSVTSPQEALKLLVPLCVGYEHERLVVVALDRRKRVVDSTVLTTGSDAFTIVDPKQVYRWALTRARPASSILVAHNHPSGDPTPSDADLVVTRRLDAAGRTLGIILVDHIIIGDAQAYTSLRERGYIDSHADKVLFTSY